MPKYLLQFTYNEDALAELITHPQDRGKVVSELSGELVAAVRHGGSIIASGILLDKQSTVERRLRAAGTVIERVVTDGDWITLVALHWRSWQNKATRSASISRDP